MRSVAPLVQSDAGYPTIDRKATTDSSILGSQLHFYLLGPRSDIIKRPTEMPAVIGESLYLTNDEDASALRSDKVLDAIARGYVGAVKAYFARFPVG